MKVTVNKYLNARIGNPSTNAPCQYYKNPGNTLEIDDVIFGTEIDGNSIWYHCKNDGCYYWSGGIEEVEFVLGAKSFNSMAEDFKLQLIQNLKNEKKIFLAKKVNLYKGVGVGYKNDDVLKGLCLRIYVTKKLLSDQLKFEAPTEIKYKGFVIPTDVKEVFTPGVHYTCYKNGEELYPDSKMSPIGVGGSICEVGVSGYGTRTLLVLKNNKPHILSCFHVLLGNLLSADSIIEYKGDKSKRIAFPSLEKNIAFNSPFESIVSEGQFDGFYDYAIAELSSRYQIGNYINGKEINGFYDEKDLGKVIQKDVFAIGATSYLQIGKITDIKSELLLKVNGFLKNYFNIIIAEKLSMPGDSGAPVVDINNKLIGYIVGGNTIDQSYILPFYNLFYKKNISII